MLSVNLLSFLNISLLLWWGCLRWYILNPNEGHDDTLHIITAGVMIIFLGISTLILNIPNYNSIIYKIGLFGVGMCSAFLIYRINGYFTNEINHMSPSNPKWYFYFAIDFLNMSSVIGFWLSLLFEYVHIDLNYKYIMQGVV